MQVMVRRLNLIQGKEKLSAEDKIKGEDGGSGKDIEISGLESCLKTGPQ